MRCSHCGEYDVAWVETDCADPEQPGETLSFPVCKNCDNGINEHTQGECDCEKGLTFYTVDVLLRAAFSLTHQMHGQHKIDTVDDRAKRDLIVAEIKRRCDSLPVAPVFGMHVRSPR